MRVVRGHLETRRTPPRQVSLFGTETIVPPKHYEHDRTTAKAGRQSHEKKPVGVHSAGFFMPGRLIAARSV